MASTGSYNTLSETPPDMRRPEGSTWPIRLGELPGRAGQGGWYLIHGSPYRPGDRRWPPGNYRAAPAEVRYHRPVNCGVDGVGAVVVGCGDSAVAATTEQGPRPHPPDGSPTLSVAIQCLPSTHRPSDSGGSPVLGRRAPAVSAFYGIPPIRPNYGVNLSVLPSWSARAGCAEAYVTQILSVYRLGFHAYAAHRALLSKRRPMAPPWYLDSPFSYWRLLYPIWRTPNLISARIYPI